MDIDQSVREARARQEAEEDACHMMGAVPIILGAAVIVPVVCLIAVVLVILFR